MNSVSAISDKEILRITKSPGAQYIFMNADSILHESNAGFADLSGGIPVSSRTTFNTFSITKTATAAAIMQLAEQDKIQLQELINPIFPEYKFKYPFTLLQLISHQAGFKNPIPISWAHLAEHDNSFDENAFVKNTIDKNAGQIFSPGGKWKYSSVGYLLLGKIIEKITGEDYSSYVLKNVIRQNEGDTLLDFKIPDFINHAVGYHQRYAFSNILLYFLLDRKTFLSGSQGSWLSFKNFYVNGKAFGGLVGNVRGLAFYLQRYLKNEMFEKPATLKLMFTDQMKGMACSWFSGNLYGNRYVCHAGGGGGYYCEIRIYPELKKASALLINKSGFSDQRLLDQIDKEYI